MHVTETRTVASADRELEQRVVNYLWGRHVPGLRRLAVTASSGTVTLKGNVRSFYERQLGSHSCRRVAGVIHVVDCIDVELPAERPAVA